MARVALPERWDKTVGKAFPSILNASSTRGGTGGIRRTGAEPAGADRTGAVLVLTAESWGLRGWGCAAGVAAADTGGMAGGAIGGGLGGGRFGGAGRGFGGGVGGGGLSPPRGGEKRGGGGG